MDQRTKNLPDYPTEEQIEESWEAYKKNGGQGVLEFLKKQRQEREGAAKGDEQKEL